MPLAIDLYCGLGGWTEALLAEGWDVIGFDIERHDYGTGGYPGQLVLQDVCTLHGAQFRDADLIVASPPCQEFSYRAMPWKRAKALPPPYLGMNLFWQCWRIQHEACEAAGRHIPMVVENVNGAQRWVGHAQARYGSFFLWGDIGRVGDAVVGPRPVFGQVVRAVKRGQKENPDGTQNGQGSWFKIADSKNRGSKNGGGSWFAIGSPGQTHVGQNPDGRKVPGMNFHEHAKTGKPGRSFQSAAVESTGNKQPGNATSSRWTERAVKNLRPGGGNSPARKAASAQIAKIPEPLARHIAKVFKPC
jgi:hypothetical protein